MALSSGKEPLFIWDPSPIGCCQQPGQADLDLPSTDRLKIPGLEKIDSGLAETWKSLKGFCSLVGRAIKTGQMLPKGILLETMASVLYTLTQMQLDTSSFDEVVKFGLLGFSSLIFLQWANIPMHYTHLSNAYRECLFKLKVADNTSSRVLLWLLMVRKMSIFTPEDDKWLKPWLRLNIDLCDVGSWAEMQVVLDSMIWLGLVHDALGESVYNSVLDR